MELALVAIAIVMLAGQKPPPPPPPAPKVPAQDPDYLTACLKGAGAGAAVGTTFSPVGTAIGAAGGCAAFAGKEWLDENWDDVKGWWRDLWD